MIAMHRICSFICAATLALVVASSAATADGAGPVRLAIDDDHGQTQMALELRLEVFETLPTKRRFGDFLIDFEPAPDSVAETVVQYVRAAVEGDEASMAALHEPAALADRADRPCNCGPRSGPYYRIPERFKSLSLQYAWHFQDYVVVAVRFEESPRSWSQVFVATRRHDGNVFISERPRSAAFDAVSFLLMLTRSPTQATTVIETPIAGLDHAVRIAGGADPITFHFDGVLHASVAGWQPAGTETSGDRVAQVASHILATSDTVDDEEFIRWFHPWVSDSVRGRATADPEFLDDVREMYRTTSDIAHVFTFALAPRYLHAYLGEDDPNALRGMLIMEHEGDLAPAGTPPALGFESILEIDAVQQYLLNLWRGQE